jgi:hypothetical protein
MIAIKFYIQHIEPLFFRKEKVIGSCAHLMLVTVIKLRSDMERCNATRALQIAQRVTMRLRTQDCWESPVGA